MKAVFPSVALNSELLWISILILAAQQVWGAHSEHQAHHRLGSGTKHWLPPGEELRYEFVRPSRRDSMLDLGRITGSILSTNDDHQEEQMKAKVDNEKDEEENMQHLFEKPQEKYATRLSSRPHIFAVVLPVEERDNTGYLTNEILRENGIGRRLQSINDRPDDQRENPFSICCTWQADKANLCTAKQHMFRSILLQNSTTFKGRVFHQALGSHKTRWKNDIGEYSNGQIPLMAETPYYVIFANCHIDDQHGQQIYLEGTLQFSRWEVLLQYGGWMIGMVRYLWVIPALLQILSSLCWTQYSTLSQNRKRLERHLEREIEDLEQNPISMDAISGCVHLKLIPIEKTTNDQTDVQVPREVHFAMEGLAQTVYEGGIYYGIILVPATYPHQPAKIELKTPIGIPAIIYSTDSSSKASIHDRSMRATMENVYRAMMMNQTDNNNDGLSDRQKRKFAANSLRYNMLTAPSFVDLFGEKYDHRYTTTGEEDKGWEMVQKHEDDHETSSGGTKKNPYNQNETKNLPLPIHHTLSCGHVVGFREFQEAKAQQGFYHCAECSEKEFDGLTRMVVGSVGLLVVGIAAFGIILCLEGNGEWEL